MFRSTAYFEIGGNYIKQYILNRRLDCFFQLFGRKQKVEERIFRLEDIDRIKSIISKRSSCFILEGEELYIKNLKFPAVRFNVMNRMITNELNYLFNNMEGITYTYSILNKTKRETDLLVYCINTNKNYLIKNLSKNISIGGIYLIQLCILDAMLPKVKEKDFLALIMYNENAYVIGCLNKKITSSSLLRNFSGSEVDLLSQLQYAVSRMKDIKKDINERSKMPLYLVNFKFKDLIEIMTSAFSCIDLGYISSDNIIRNF